MIKRQSKPDLASGKYGHWRKTASWEKSKVQYLVILADSVLRIYSRQGFFGNWGQRSRLQSQWPINTIDSKMFLPLVTVCRLQKTDQYIWCKLFPPFSNVYNCSQINKTSTVSKYASIHHPKIYSHTIFGVPNWSSVGEKKFLFYTFDNLWWPWPLRCGPGSCVRHIGFSRTRWPWWPWNAHLRKLELNVAICN